MSADNCIAILKTTDKFKIKTKYLKKNMFGTGVTAYRVAHIQGHRDYGWYIENQIHNLGCWLSDLFGESEVHYKEKQAHQEAQIISEVVGYTEYGILKIDASDYNFPGC